MTRNGPTDGFGRRLSPPSHSSHEGFIPPHGGCERLFACTKSQIICDATVRFCDRFISPESRTHDRRQRKVTRSIAERIPVCAESFESEPVAPLPSEN